MKILTKIHVVFLFAIFIVACNPRSEEFPTGVYVDHNGGVVEFKEDGTYGVSDSEGEEPVISGVYVIDNDTITIRDNLFYCPDYVGTYHWSVGDDHFLNLEIIEEECTRREQVLVKGLTFLHP
jgi:hypothetical protein